MEEIWGIRPGFEPRPPWICNQVLHQLLITCTCIWCQQSNHSITNDHTSRWTSIWFDITFISSYHGLQLVIFDILSFLPNSSFSQMMRPRSLMTFPTSVSSSTIRRVLSSGSPETINGRYYCESLTMWMHIDI